MFSEILAVCDESNRVVPVYTDKHLADNWEDAKWIYDQAHRRGMPLMAGSTLPLTWRYPPIDVTHGSHVSEIVATAYSSLEAYGYHGLEILQCLAERRASSEAGMHRADVRGCATVGGARQWYNDRALIEAATSRRRHSLGSTGRAAGKDRKGAGARRGHLPRQGSRPDCCGDRP